MANARQVACWIVDDIIAYIRDCPDIDFTHLFQKRDSSIRLTIANDWVDTAEAYVKKYSGDDGE